MASPAAARVVEAATERGLTVATGESLTGGAVAAAVVDVPGASLVLTGGVVAYGVRQKIELLGVDAALLASGGPVQAEVAVQLAAGARRVCRADLGVGTTGVAGPGPADGYPAGTLYLAVVGPGDDDRCSLALTLPGDRDTVRAATVAAALGLLADVVLAVRVPGHGEGYGESPCESPSDSPSDGEERDTPDG